MRMSKREKLLIALLTAGCLACTTGAWAAKIEVNEGDTRDKISETVSNWSVVSTADVYGSGVYNAGTIIEISNSTFTNNNAEGVFSYGGAIGNLGTISKISNSTFTGNKASNGYGEYGSYGSYGGAIYNDSTGFIDEISDCTFDGNSSTTNDGGAIYNAGLMVFVDEEDHDFYGGISGSTFTGNKASESGGAIYNSGVIYEISRSGFDGNSAASGGAIYNVTGDEAGGVIGSIEYTTFKDNTATGDGGAIYNEEGAAIGDIGVTPFESNTATGNGGAIYNAGTIGYDSYTLYITSGSVGESGTKEESESGGGPILYGDFASNAAAYGGAIYNADSGIIGTEDSQGILNVNFVENQASESGGAIYNAGVIAEISSDDERTFEVNKALGGDGGAIYNAEDASIGNVNGMIFDGNSAAGDGGAIYNAGTIGSASYELDDTTYNVSGGISSTDFVGNVAAGDGGAIYNTGTLGTLTNVAFEGNSSGGKGGAIYTTTDLTFVADGSDDDDDSGNEVDVHFSDNAAAEGGDAIYMDSADGTITFELVNGGTVALEDGIDGEDGYSVAISGDSLDTTFYLLGDLNNANFSIGNTTLNTSNDEVHEYAVSSFTLTDDVNFVGDIDLENEKMDRFTAESYGDIDGTLTVTGLNAVSDATADRIVVYFAEDALMKNVTSPLSEAIAPIFEYKVNYVYLDEDGTVYDENEETYAASGSELLGSSDTGGYFVLEKTGYNPAVLATSIAAMGAYNAMGLMYESNFEHSDYFMKLSAEDRLALSEQQKKAKRAPKENDTTRPEYYNRHELTERGAWMRAFASNESVDYGGGWESRDKYWGAMVGFDSNMRVSKNGWANVTTGYAGTLGIRQEYSGGRIKQHGGFVGVTESFYKKNFYTAWTIAAGTTKAHEHTTYGKDTNRINDYGIAARFGWNINLGDGKFSLLPTFTASYSTVRPEDFTNAAGTDIHGSGFRALQLNPNVKFIMNMKDGWQPYLTVGEVWTVGESSHIYADQFKLDEFDLDPYTEYGIGVQKRWANRSDAYLQLLGHSHGRDGFLVNAGVRWSF